MNEDAGKDLMLEFQATGDREAGHRLFTMYRKPVWRFLLMLTRSDSVADDLSQRVWLRVIEVAERGAYRPRRNTTFRTYLFTIARNLFIDGTRSASSKARHADESELECIEDNNVVPMDSMVAAEHDKTALRTAMLQLPDEQREVLVMWSEGLGFNEIAAIVGAPRNTVIGRKRYGIEKLKGILKEREAGSGCGEVSQ